MTLIKVRVTKLHAGDRLVSGRTVKSAEQVPGFHAVEITYTNGSARTWQASADVLVVKED